MKQMLMSMTLVSALALSACSKPDEAALAKGDAAFKGQTIDGRLQPVAAQPVMVGRGGSRAPACSAVAAPAAETLTVRWSASAVGPAKAEVEGNVAVCEVDGAWTGIVFPAFGQELDECYTASTVGSPREYQGPCRSGWVESDKLAAVAE